MARFLVQALMIRQWTTQEQNGLYRSRSDSRPDDQTGRVAVKAMPVN